MRRILFLVGILFLTAVSCSNGDEQEFVFTLRCLQGEGDSLNETRKGCYEEAQSQAVEQACDYLEAQQKSWGFHLGRDNIRSVASAFVQTEILDESIEHLKNTNALSLKIRAKISTRSAKGRLAEVAEQAPVTSGKVNQVSQKVEASSNTTPLETRPLSESTPGRPPKPKPGTPVIPPPSGSTQKPDAIERLVKGMTPMDVEAILGKAEVSKQNHLEGVSYDCRRHSGVWVIFRNGSLQCVKNRLEYKASLGGDCHCQGLSMNFLLR